MPYFWVGTDHESMAGLGREVQINFYMEIPMRNHIGLMSENFLICPRLPAYLPAQKEHRLVPVPFIQWPVLCCFDSNNRFISGPDRAKHLSFLFNVIVTAVK